ncbi:hypothetical protein N9N13_03350 [Opitutales bacterium]|jgi:hypothetical protein|nr:hypothetical protein [Opitutales bacterium]
MVTRLIILFCFTLQFSIAQEILTLTSTRGDKIQATILKVEEEKVYMRRSDGVSFQVSINIFDEASRGMILKYINSGKDDDLGSSSIDSLSISFEEINTILGNALFVDNSLWDDDPSEVASRLKWPSESSTENSQSFRFYSPATYKFASVRPYSAALYGGRSTTLGISLVFANKGDCFASAGVGEEHFKEGDVTKDPKILNEWIERDEEKIIQKMESLLGKARRQNYGQGSAKRKVSRWDWLGHSFLLSIAEGDFVSLAVDTIERANARGKVRKVADMHIRRIHRANVEKRGNGDVVIRNIPMVDQGPKGYCVPATFERCMRYMEVPADMYLLAMAGSTGLGGGTHTPTLVESVQKEVWSAGRTFKSLRGHPSFKELMKFIDSGIPILWGLHSTDRFNQIANARTKDRIGASLDSWKDTIKKATKEIQNFPRPHISEARHICIIHGYNKETGEIAFTDSWGDRYKERWIGVEEASHFSQNNCWVIEY